MKHSIVGLLVLLAVIPAFASRGYGQSIPPIDAKALDDSHVVLPKTGSTQMLILVLGFSHKSGDNCSPWDKRLAAEFHTDARTEYYQIPVLANAPSFVRPMILKGMRKGVPLNEQARFVPVYDHEPDWKKLVNFSAPDDPYLILAHPDGLVVWQEHGLFSEKLYGELKDAIAQAVSGNGKK